MLNVVISSAVVVLVGTPIVFTTLHLMAKRREEALQAVRVEARRQRRHGHHYH